MKTKNRPEKKNPNDTMLAIAAAAIFCAGMLSVALAKEGYLESWATEPLAMPISLFPWFYIAAGAYALLAGYVYASSEKMRVAYLIAFAWLLWMPPFALTGFSYNDAIHRVAEGMYFDEMLAGQRFFYDAYARNFPTFFAISYGATQVAGIDPQLFARFVFPIAATGAFVMLAYFFLKRLTDDKVAFIALALLIPLMHFFEKHPSPRMTAMVMGFAVCVLVMERRLLFKAIGAITGLLLIAAHATTPLLFFGIAALFSLKNYGKNKAGLAVIAALLVAWLAWNSGARFSGGRLAIAFVEMSEGDRPEISGAEQARNEKSLVGLADLNGTDRAVSVKNNATNFKSAGKMNHATALQNPEATDAAGIGSAGKKPKFWGYAAAAMLFDSTNDIWFCIIEYFGIFALGVAGFLHLLKSRLKFRHELLAFLVIFFLSATYGIALPFLTGEQENAKIGLVFMLFSACTLSGAYAAWGAQKVRNIAWAFVVLAALTYPYLGYYGAAYMDSHPIEAYGLEWVAENAVANKTEIFIPKEQELVLFVSDRKNPSGTWVDYRNIKFVEAESIDADLLVWRKMASWYYETHHIFGSNIFDEYFLKIESNASYDKAYGNSNFEVFLKRRG